MSEESKGLGAIQEAEEEEEYSKASEHNPIPVPVAEDERDDL